MDLWTFIATKKRFFRIILMKNHNQWIKEKESRRRKNALGVIKI